MGAEDDLGWWTISGVDILWALKRAHSGEDPGLIYAEMYANSVQHKFNDGKCTFHGDDCEDD